MTEGKAAARVDPDAFSVGPAVANLGDHAPGKRGKRGGRVIARAADETNQSTHGM
jgi:hypothetical protein